MGQNEIMEIQKVKFNDVYSSLEKNELSPYNFYNIDIGIDQYLATEYYLKNPQDNIEKSQKIQKVFLDIEVFTNHNMNSNISEMVLAGKNPVNAISHYYSSENRFYCYFLLPENNKNFSKQQIEDYLNIESSKPVQVGYNDDKSPKYDTYFQKNQESSVELFNNATDLVIALFEKIKSDDPAILSGWNSDNFDYPYLYQFLLNSLGNETEVSKIMSRFSEVSVENGRDRAGNSVRWIRIPEFNIADLMYCYKARDDGGLGLGKKAQSYALNNIALSELGLQKFEYKSEGLTLDQFYEQDPLNFLLYNLWDTVLVQRIDQKTGIIDLYNMQRRKMCTPLSLALRGSSPLFDTYIYGDLKQKNTYVRWGINNEGSFAIPEKEISQIPKITGSKKINWSVSYMTSRETSKILNRFPGAYVKNPVPGIYENSTISDLDANRLYPSMINQYNIGINTFFGRILPPTLNSVFDFFQREFSHRNPNKIPEVVYQRFFLESERFVENLKVDEFDSEEEERNNKFQNKNEAKQFYYFSLVYLYKKILESGFSLDQLMTPKNLNEYLVSKVYFNNLIELMEMCNPQEREYNAYAYKWIINNENINDEIKIIENYNNPNYSIIKLNGKDFSKYLHENQLGVTISGTLFKIHENELSIFYEFLNELYALRNKYKHEMFKYEKNSFDYNEFNRRQSTTKVIMNSTYGLLGMSSFRYSNKWLAKTITTSGRLALKTAQYYAEKYIDSIK